MDPTSILLPLVIPDHELIRRIGKGSYGEVWLARTQIGAYRAVKIVYGERFGADERPFERELDGLKRFEPISRSHPGLMAILHFGQNLEAGYFYYVMELGDDRVRGAEIDAATYVPRTLAAESKERVRLSVKECVELGVALADALDAIHQRGLVHRDIKPSNIIFVAGTPKLADVGLVTDMRQANSYVGTEGFIAPEGPGSPQGDIYSLGKLLYEISTGKDRTDFPTLPPDLAESKDFLELNEVLVKACRADLRGRYPTAKAMAGDLKLLRSGDSVRRLHTLERWWTRFKRIGTAALVLVPVLVLIYFQIDYRHKRAAEIRQLKLGGYLADGSYALNQGDYPGSLSPFLSALSLEEGDAERSRTHRLRVKAILDRCPKLAQVFFHDRSLVEQAEFSLAGDLVVTALNYGSAQVWNTTAGEAISPPFAGRHSLESAAFSPNGKYVVTAGHYGAGDVWEALTGKHVLELPRYDGLLNSARFSPDGGQIITAGSNWTACIWGFPSGELKTVLPEHTNAVIFAGYSHDGRRILTAGKDGMAFIWDSSTFRVQLRLPHKNWVYHGDFSPDGRLLVTASFDRYARLWDADTGEPLYPEMAHGDGVMSARFSPDGRHIVTACLDGTVRLWDVLTRQPVTPNPVLRHGDRVMDASFSGDGRHVLSACADGTARIWDLAGGAEEAVQTTNFYSMDGTLVNGSRIPGLNLQALAAAPAKAVFPKYTISRNGRYVIELREKGTNAVALQGWDIELARPISRLINLPGEPLGSCISEEGKRALVYSRRSAEMYDLGSGKRMHPAFETGSSIAGATFSRDGQYVAIHGGSVAQVWEVETGRPIFLGAKQRGRLRYAEFSPDSRKLVVCATSDGFERHFAQIWFPATGESLANLMHHGDGVLMAAFSPDNQSLVTASEDFYATAWETATGKQMPPSMPHENQVLFANYSRNGHWIVTASADSQVRLWDGATRKPLTPPMTFPTFPEENLFSARFVEGDGAVFVTSVDGQAWLWPLSQETRTVEELRWLCELVSGGGDFEMRRFNNSSSARLKEGWRKFRKEKPGDFRASQAEIRAWHQRELEQARANGQTNAVEFHRKILNR